MSLDLYIGNKNYSSWSLRPWLLLKHLGIPFTEHMVSVGGRDYNPALRPIAGNAKVPCLHADGFQIWESLAIAEYLAEQHPQLWPVDTLARARARSISAEMHSGFVELRKAMPMNLKFKLKGKPATEAVQRDIDRIVEIWTEARTRFATHYWPTRRCRNGMRQRCRKVKRTRITTTWLMNMAGLANETDDFECGVGGKVIDAKKQCPSIALLM